MPVRPTTTANAMTTQSASAARSTKALPQVAQTRRHDTNAQHTICCCCRCCRSGRRRTPYVRWRSTRALSLCHCHNKYTRAYRFCSGRILQRVTLDDAAARRRASSLYSTRLRCRTRKVFDNGAETSTAEAAVAAVAATFSQLDYKRSVCTCGRVCRACVYVYV